MAAESVLTVEELAVLEEVSPEILRRWAVQGKRGVHLDAIHRPGAGWVSSRAAVARFRAAIAVQEVIRDVRGTTLKGG